MTNYRGITLIDTAYKIYISILNDKIKKVAEKRMEERQFGFRTRRRTTDAIFTLNYIVNRELSKNKGKIFAFFADFKAAFDRVNRANLEGILREAGIKERQKENYGNLQRDKTYSKGRRKKVQKILDKKQSQTRMPH